MSRVELLRSCGHESDASVLRNRLRPQRSCSSKDTGGLVMWQMLDDVVAQVVIAPAIRAKNNAYWARKKRKSLFHS
jgi:hypothetical protein